MSEGVNVQNSVPSLFWNRVYQNKEIIGIVTGLVIGILGYCVAQDFSTSLGEWATHVKYISGCTGGMIFLISCFLRLDAISSSEITMPEARIGENPSQTVDNRSKGNTSSKNQALVQTPPQSPVPKLTLLQELKSYLSNISARTPEQTQSFFNRIHQNDDREAFILLLKEENLFLTPELTKSFFDRIYKNDDREAFILFVKAKKISFTRDNMIDRATVGHANVFDGMCELNPTLAQEVINLGFLNGIFDTHANNPQTIYRLLHSISLIFPARFNEFIRGCDQHLTNVFNQLIQLDAISNVISQDKLNYTRLAIFLLEKNVGTNLSVRLRQAINLRSISLVDVIVSRRNHYHVDDVGDTLLHHAMSWDTLYNYLTTKREIFEAPERRVMALPNGLRSGLSSTPSSPALLSGPMSLSSSSVAVAVPQPNVEPNVEPAGLLSAVVDNARIDVNAQNRAGNTALHDAIFAGHWHKIYFLITQLNANAEIQNHDGRSAYSLLRSRYSIATPNEIEEIRQLLMLMLAKSGTPQDQIANQIGVIRADTKTALSSLDRGFFSDKMNTALEFNLIDHVKPYVKFLNVEDFEAGSPVDRFLQNLLVQYRAKPTRSKKELLELLLQQKEMIASTSFDRRSFINKMNTALDLDIIVHVKPYIKLLNAEDFAAGSPVDRFLQNLLVQNRANPAGSKKELLELLLQQKSVVDTRNVPTPFDRRSFIDTMNTALDLNSIDHVKPYIELLNAEDFAAGNPLDRFLQNLLVRYKADRTSSKKELLECLLQQKSVVDTKTAPTSFDRRSFVDAMDTALDLNSIDHVKPYIKLLYVEDFAPESPVDRFLQKLFIQNRANPAKSKKELLELLLERKGVPVEEIGQLLKSSAQVRREMGIASRAAIENAQSSKDPYIPPLIERHTAISDNEAHEFNEGLVAVVFGLGLKSNAQTRMEMEAAQRAGIEKASSSNDDPFAVDSDHEINNPDYDLDEALRASRLTAGSSCGSSDSFAVPLDNESLQIMNLMAFGNSVED